MGDPVSDPSVINAEIFYQGKIPPILQLRAEAQTHSQSVKNLLRFLMLNLNLSESLLISLDDFLDHN